MNIMAEAQAALEEARNEPAPVYVSTHRYGNLPVFEVDGPLGEKLLVAFGLISLSQWLNVVNKFHAEHTDESEPWNPEDPDKVVDCLNRLHYDRVAVTTDDDGRSNPQIDWRSEGMIAVTVWSIERR